ncbi:hypothetical protein FJ967_09435 [Mesorhizobium sp. B2-3-4]|nr:hypothetical protein FJ967_09435 [Mesorhizobium sp. B2-3-4]
MDATRTGSVLIKPVVHTASSESSVQSVYGNPMVRSLRLERPLVETTSTVRITEKAYAFAPPPRIKVGTPAPVNASFEPKVGAPAFGGSPYICSPSGFGQHASCRARYL